jgi:hypothetical protein
MKASADFYETLGIRRTASADDVRAAYRRLARQYHPDRYEGRGDSAETMARINQAYAVLSDPAARTGYDASLRPSVREQAAAMAKAAEIAAQDKRPWLMVSAVACLIVLALGWVAVRTLVPKPVQATPIHVAKPAPVDMTPIAPVTPIQPWTPPPPAVHAGPASTEPVARLIREGVIDKPAKRN